MRPMPLESYANENFDRAQAIAKELANERRKAGRAYPPFGYAKEDFEDALTILSESVLKGRA